MPNLLCRATLALAVLSAGTHARAQAVEVSAGSSTMYNATGASVGLHTDTSDWTLGAGVQQRRFAAGGSMQRRTQAGVITLGLQQVRADLPTDIFDTTHRLVGVGVGFAPLVADHSNGLSVFLGMSSVDGGSPLFRSGDLEQPQVYVQWSQPLLERCRLVSLGLYLEHPLALQSIECPFLDANKLILAASAGAGPSGLYAAASLRYTGDRLHLKAAYFDGDGGRDRNTASYGPLPEPANANASFDYKISRDWDAWASHQQFIIPASTTVGGQTPSTPSERTTLNQAGLGCTCRLGLFSVTALSSSELSTSSTATTSSIGNGAPVTVSSRSMSVSFSRDIGPLHWTENLFLNAPMGLPRQAMVENGVELRVSPHLQLAETVDVANGTTTFAHGGEFITGHASLRVSYETVYLASQPQQPWQQLTLVSAQAHLLRMFSLEVSTDVTPMGKPLYTVRLATAASHTPSMGGNAVSVHVGQSVLTGLVVDQLGHPVPGAALAVGGSFLYTDSHGFFMFRENRSAAHPLRVVLEEFLTPERYAVQSAPATVASAREPGQAVPVRIVLRRLPLDTAVASLDHASTPPPQVHP